MHVWCREVLFGVFEMIFRFCKQLGIVFFGFKCDNSWQIKDTSSESFAREQLLLESFDADDRWRQCLPGLSRDCQQGKCPPGTWEWLKNISNINVWKRHIYTLNHAATSEGTAEALSTRSRVWMNQNQKLRSEKNDEKRASPENKNMTTKTLNFLNCFREKLCALRIFLVASLLS